MTKIRELRKERGMTLAQTAFLAAIDEGFLSKAERGWKIFPKETRSRLLRVLGVESEDLVFDGHGRAKE